MQELLLKKAFMLLEPGPAVYALSDPDRIALRTIHAKGGGIFIVD